MENNKYSNFEKLKNRVWKTFKSRINTAERLKKNNEFIAFLSIYYSTVLAAVSILNYINKDPIIDVVTIVLSVMVTILFLYFEGRNYKERYIKMKSNYNELNLLYYKIDNAIELGKYENESFDEFTNRYIELLNNVENHLEKDYIQYAMKEKEIIIKNNIKIKYYFNYFVNLFIKFFTFSIPTVILAFSFWQLIF